MSASPTDASAHQLIQMQVEGSLSAREITEAHLKAIQAHEPDIQAFLRVDSESALQQATAIDEKRRQGQPLGPLAGVPVALKDVLCVTGQPTTCASRMLENFRPPYDAHVVERLRAADAVLIGKTNLDEFAMGSSTENSAFQVTRNPWDTTRIPGGSSGGSAAAVASGEVPLSLGTDTGGSIRQPAGLCGIVGMKPTYGRVSRYGLIAFASSLDQIGPFARNVADCALLLGVIAGHDRRDSTSVDRPVPDYLLKLDEPVKPLTVGVPREFFGEGLDPQIERTIRTALDVYRAAGATVKEISLPHSKYAVAAYYLVAPSEASSNLARYDGMHYGLRVHGESNEKRGLIRTTSRTRDASFGPEVKRRIMLGTFALSSGYKDAYYSKALQVRRLIKQDFDAAFQECDVIVGPTSPTAAFKIGEKSDDPLSMYLTDVYTISCNLAGIAGLSLPCGFTDENLPIGLQILASPFEEEKLFRVARMYERATDWHTRRPPRFGGSLE